MTPYRKTKIRGYKKTSDYIFEIIISVIGVIAAMLWFAFVLNISGPYKEAYYIVKSGLWATGVTVLAIILNSLYGGEEAWNRPSYNEYIRRLRKIAGKKQK